MSQATQNETVFANAQGNTTVAPWAQELVLEDDVEMPKPGAGDTVGTAFKLLFVSIGGFIKGILLAGLLNIIPFLPTVSRTTGSLMARAFAIVLFLPFAVFVIGLFPLLFIEGYRAQMDQLMADALAWYDKKDLEQG